MYAIVDCNNFYVSCERSFRPDLSHTPVVVLSNNDGCVVSRSKEAKALGIPMAAPAFKYKKLFEEHQVQVFSSNYSLYGDMSSRVMHILEQFAVEVEVYSIDEAFIQLPPHINDYVAYGSKIKKTIHQCTGIPTSIGIATTKALAKVANNVTKKFQEKTQGVFVINSDTRRIKTLRWTVISDVWGIGAGNQKRLQAVGVRTAYDFIQLSDQWVRTHMTVIGLRLKKELEGVSVLALEDIKHKRAIATTRSFEHTFSEFEDLKERVATFAYSCAEKLRKQASCCVQIYVFLRTNKYQSVTQHKVGSVITLPYPTDSTLVIIEHAIRVLKMIHIPNVAYKKAGVMLLDLRPSGTKQLDIFENENPKHKPLMQAMDALNQKYGSYKIKIGNQDLERTWKMKQEHLSPRYTSRFSDIIEVNCEK